MNDPELPDLPSDIAHLLDEARGTPGAPDAQRRRVAARLALSVGMAVPAASLAGARVVGHAWLGKVVGLAAFVALTGGLARLATHHPAGPATVTVTRSGAPRSDPPRDLGARVTAPTTSPIADPSAPAPAPVLPPLVHPASSTAATTNDEDRSFRDELALLDRALAALGRDDPAGASSTLAVHARRFPRGRLAPEREALRVRCAAAGGDAAAAEIARRRFHRRFPDSVLGAAVDRAVEGASAPR